MAFIVAPRTILSLHMISTESRTGHLLPPAFAAAGSVPGFPGQTGPLGPAFCRDGCKDKMLHGRTVSATCNRDGFFTSQSPVIGDCYSIWFGPEYLKDHLPTIGNGPLIAITTNLWGSVGASTRKGCSVEVAVRLWMSLPLEPRPASSPLVFQAALKSLPSFGVKCWALFIFIWCFILYFTALENVAQGASF